MGGECDVWGAVIQPEGRGGTAPYTWFVFVQGYAGDAIVKPVPLRTPGLPKAA
jgi:hypothetical protein